MAKKWKSNSYTGTVEGAIEGAKADIESLKEEMESWRDGMEENLSHTQKYEEVSEAYDALETIVDKLEEVELGDLPGNIGDTSVTYTEMSPYGRKGAPRWMRLSNAQSMIDAAKSAIEAARDEAQEEGDDVEVSEETQEAVDELRRSMAEESGEPLPEDVDWGTPIDALDEALSGCDDVNFPGMY